ncbi:MAG TPA: UPF0149 family protein [Acidobacteriaceae bacterium]|nr:UPF0149 family protein [Acidobacteriaceae bacterium]
MEQSADREKRPPLDQSLNDAEKDRLKTLLSSFPGEDAMDLEEMDGFFAALICGPVLVSTSEYLPEVWGGEDAPFDTADDLNEFLNLAMRHWNSIARKLGHTGRCLPALARLRGRRGDPTG